MSDEYNPKHPHEPEIPAIIAPDEHCRICRLLVKADALRAQLAQAEKERDEARRDRSHAYDSRDEALAQVDALRGLVTRFLHREDCPFCDFGKLRKPYYGGPPSHDSDCVYAHAASALAATPPQALADLRARIEREVWLEAAQFLEGEKIGNPISLENENWNADIDSIAGRIRARAGQPEKGEGV